MAGEQDQSSKKVAESLLVNGEAVMLTIGTIKLINKWLQVMIKTGETQMPRALAEEMIIGELEVVAHQEVIEVKAEVEEEETAINVINQVIELEIAQMQIKVVNVVVEEPVINVTKKVI